MGFITPNSADLFSVEQMTGYVNEVPFVPGAVGQLFESSGISTTVASLDKRSGSIALITDKARGAAANVYGGESGSVVHLGTRYLPLKATIGPDAVQNARAYGDTELDTFERARNRVLDDLKKSHALTLEHQRVEALKGLITNATTPVNLFTAFGETQTTVEMLLSTGGTDVRGKSLDIVEAIEDAIGGSFVTEGYVAYLGKTAFRKLIDHAKVKDAYARWQEGAALRNDVRSGFEFGGIVWKAYRGKVGATALIVDDEGYVAPIASGLFKTLFAPAHMISFANAAGLPMYASAYELPHGAGLELHTESCPISFVAKPSAVVKIVTDTVA